MRKISGVKVKKIEELERKVLELEDRWKRALADYDNLRKRVEKEKEEFVKYAAGRVIGKFLNVYDDLKICSRHLKDKGLDLICAHFDEVLKSEGVEKILALGEDFNPQIMEAVEIIEGPEGKVIEVVQEGYRLGEKILRPARVKVGGGEKLEKKKDSKKTENELLRGDYV